MTSQFSAPPRHSAAPTEQHAPQLAYPSFSELLGKLRAEGDVGPAAESRAPGPAATGHWDHQEAPPTDAPVVHQLAASVVADAIAPDLVPGGFSSSHGPGTETLYAVSADARPAQIVRGEVGAARPPQGAPISTALTAAPGSSVDAAPRPRAVDFPDDELEALVDDLALRDVAREALRARLVAFGEGRVHRSAYEIVFLLLAFAMTVLITAPPLVDVLLALHGTKP